MNTHADTLRFPRLALLLKRDALTGGRGAVIAMLAVAGLTLIISALSLLGGNGREFHFGFYSNLLFIGGFIVTSLAFREAESGGRGILYLTLPASPVEKFASKLLLTSLGYAAGSLVFYTAVAALSEWINRSVFGFGHPFFNPFSPAVLRLAAAYLVLQSVFLAGSAWFRRMAFIRTVLFTIAVSIAFAVVIGLTALIIFRDFIPFGSQAGGFDNRMFFGTELQSWLDSVGRSFSTVLRVIFWAALAPACWLTGYLKLREIEA